MKRLTPLSILFAITLTAMANPIDVRKAQTIAQEYMIPGHTMTLAAKAQRTPAKMLRIAPSVAATSPYYVFSRGTNQGYVVVSGDDCLPEVLGYTDSGDFDADNLPPALQDMLDVFALVVEDAQMNGTNTTAVNKAPNRAAARNDIAPLTSSHWHQSSPYNDICPSRVDNGAKAMTGCVATAASQILYYWRRDLPSTLQATTPTYSYGNAHPDVSFPKGSPVKWELMRDSYNSEPTEYKQAVAEFCYQVGTATWLTYAEGTGTATSGNIENIPNTFNSFFGMNGGKVIYRSGYSQENWTQAIYDELAKGRPVMYTGVHPNNGGHAVYIDGYKASDDRMHFNFGWGGQGDGYWTTTLEDGMNGFNDYQSALIGAYPKNWNLDVKIAQPAHVYANQENCFTITIENNSTLPFQGIYLFSASNTSKPTDLKKAQSSNLETLIATDSKSIVTLTAKPTSVKTWYITATDENLNVLAQIPVETENAEAKLSAMDISALTSCDTKVVGDNTYSIVYSNKVTIESHVYNDADVNFGGTAKIDIYSSDDNGATFNLYKTLSKANTTIAPKATGSATYSFTGMEEGKLYYAAIQPEWGSYSLPTTVDITTNNPRIYFCSAGASNMKGTLSDNNVLTFTGNWDAAAFQSAVALKSNATAIEYDLTQVTGIATVPDTEYPMPNALVVVVDDSQAQGTNVICRNYINGDFRLTAGYDYHPKGDEMHAFNNISLNINQQPNRWYLLTAPFNTEVPNGIIARDINTHKQTSSGINNATTNVKTLEGGKTYLVMTSSLQRQTLTYRWDNDVETATLPSTTKSNTDPAIIGTFTATTLPTGAKTVKDKDTDKQYFITADEGETSEGLRGYFYDEKMLTSSTDFRAYSNMTLDPAYITLGQQIQNLYNARDTYSNIVSDQANADMNDTIATAEQLYSDQTITTATTVKKRAQALEEWIEKYKTMVGNIGNTEVDLTSLIVNPSFEESTTTAKGWTADTANDAKIRQNSNLNYMTVHGEGNNFLYNSTGSRVSQTITDLKPGKYTVTAMLGSEDETKITLTANQQSTTVAAHPFGKHYLTKAEATDITVDTNGTLTISVSANGWYNADNFTLTFISNDEQTAIQNITNTTATPGIYTLQGIQVTTAKTPGIYIINGKKTIVNAR